MNTIKFSLIFVLSVILTTCQTCKTAKLCSSANRFFKPHIAGLILARGGSKGIKLKNISKVNNRTLLEIAISAAQEVGEFTSIWVSTDHQLIYEEANRLGVNIHWRGEATALDNASSVLAVQEFIETHKEVDIVALIQCTSPFMKAEYLKEALGKILYGKECVFSVSRVFKLRWAEEGSNLIPLNFKIDARPRRQDWKGELVENGMFYFSKRELIKRGILQSLR